VIVRERLKEFCDYLGVAETCRRVNESLNDGSIGLDECDPEMFTEVAPELGNLIRMHLDS
jgi:hypothetical protein